MRSAQQILNALRGIRALTLPESVALVCIDDMRKIAAALNVAPTAASMAKFAAHMAETEKSLRRAARAARG